MRKWLLVVIITAFTMLAFSTTAMSFDLGGLAGKAKDVATQEKSKDKVENTEKTGKSDSEKVTLPPYKGPKKRLAVMDMEVKVTATQTVDPTTTGGVVTTTSVYLPPPTDFGTGLTEMLTTALIDSNRFIMLERKALADIQQEQSLGASGAVDQTSAPGTGKLLGAQVLIRGAVTEYTYKKSSTGGNASFLEGVGVAASKAEASVTLDIRMYNVTTGQIIDSVKAEGRAKATATKIDVDKPDYKVSGSGFKQSPLGHATRQAIERAVQFICQRMESIPWEGRIAEMDMDDNGKVATLYLNAGSDTGLKVGDSFEIVRPGRDIVDPETKVVIGRTKDKLLGKCKIETISKNLSTAAVLEGDTFQMNDIVRCPDADKTLKPSKTPEASTTQENLQPDAVAAGTGSEAPQQTDGAAPSETPTANQ